MACRRLFRKIVQRATSVNRTQTLTLRKLTVVVVRGDEQRLLLSVECDSVVGILRHIPAVPRGIAALVRFPMLFALRPSLQCAASTNALKRLEKDGARILRAVQRRIDIRNELMSKVGR